MWLCVGVQKETTKETHTADSAHAHSGIWLDDTEPMTTSQIPPLMISVVCGYFVLLHLAHLETQALDTERHRPRRTPKPYQW